MALTDVVDTAKVRVSQIPDGAPLTPGAEADIRPRRGGRVSAYVLIGLLFAGSVTFLVLALLQRSDTKNPGGGDAAVAAARTQALNIMTLDHRTAKRDLQRVVDASIGTMHDQYAQAESGTIATTTSEKSVSTGTILSAGLSSLKGNSAEVLVAGDATVQFPKSGKVKASKVRVHYRFRLQMQEKDGVWKSSQLAFAGLPSYSQVTS